MSVHVLTVLSTGFLYRCGYFVSLSIWVRWFWARYCVCWCWNVCEVGHMTGCWKIKVSRMFWACDIQFTGVGKFSPFSIVDNSGLAWLKKIWQTCCWKHVADFWNVWG